MTTQEADTVSEQGRIGLFGVGARRLAELGYMSKVQKIPWGESKEIFMGEFFPPLTLEKFLCAPLVQVQVFEQDMKERCDAIHRGELSSFISSEVTLSGILALTHSAGIKGALSWLLNGEDAEKFPNTTQNFARANGVF